MLESLLAGGGLVLLRGERWRHAGPALGWAGGRGAGGASADAWLGVEVRLEP